MFYSSTYPIQVTKVEKNADGTLKVTTKMLEWNEDGKLKGTHAGDVIDNVSNLIWAVGRKPRTENLNLKAVGLKTDRGGHIIVDDYQNANSDKNVYAVGDVCGNYQLTPGKCVILGWSGN